MNTAWLERLESYIVIALLLMMAVVLALGTAELGVRIAEEVIAAPRPFLLDVEELQRLFGFFLVIVIGIELLETLRIYLEEHTVHAEVILTVAITALARKVIIADVGVLSPMSLVGMGILVFALAVGYYLIKRAFRESAKSS